MTAAYVPTCAPGVAVDTTRTAFVVPEGAPSAVTTWLTCVIPSGGSVRVVVPSVEPSPARSVRVTVTLEVVAFAKKASVRNAVSSRRLMSDFGEAGVTKSFAPWAGTD